MRISDWGSDVCSTDLIAAQVEAGVDIGNDGEQARESFVTYVAHRMTGFGGTSQRAMKRDLAEHPDFVELALPARRVERKGDVEGTRDSVRVDLGGCRNITYKNKMSMTISQIKR